MHALDKHTGKPQPGHILATEDLLDVALKIYQFSCEATEHQPYPYQDDFSLRIVQSAVLNDGADISALFARQSGKTEGCAIPICGLLVMLPLLANLPRFKDDVRLNRFKNGIRVGIFAPTFHQAAIMYNRICSRMRSKKMRETLKDPEIALDLPEGKSLVFSNGSLVHCKSAAPNANIEGETYDLIIAEECQDITNFKLRKSIQPMLASTNGTMIKIGTPNTLRNDFFDTCERNRKSDLYTTNKHERKHFEYDWEYAAQSNPRYARFVESEIERHGYDSDEIRMSYRLHWLVERSTFLAPELIEACAIKETSTLTHTDSREVTHKFKRKNNIVYRSTKLENIVGGLDIGRTNDSTVLTLLHPFWESPFNFDGKKRYPSHILNWLEIAGDDHEQQFPQILEELSQYKVKTLVVDATGRGDPVYDRLRYALKSKGVKVIPFVFSQKSKHEGFTVLLQETQAGRITFPYGDDAKKATVTRRFMQQMSNLEKRWNGGYMVVEAPKASGGKRKKRSEEHDDYPDSLMLACWGVNCARAVDEAEVIDNPLIGNRAVYDTLARQTRAAERLRRRIEPRKGVRQW